MLLNFTAKMEHQNQANSNVKRPRDDDECEQRKIQRSASAAELEHTTKITDLNDDCLTKMFGYLNLQSLFNVAVANEWLRPAANEVYKRKFDTKIVKISGLDYRRKKKQYSVPKEYGSNGIRIVTLKTSLQYLRCFGPSVSNLKIIYQAAETKRYEYVHQYISDYCADTLACIEFQSMPNIPIKQFQKVFVNVKEVAVINTVLEQHLQSFAEWFPNLSCLKLHYSQRGQCFTTEPFQHLEQLSVFGPHAFYPNGFVTDVLRGAHQLTRVDVYIFGEEEFPIESLLDMIKDKPLLAEFTYEASKICHPMAVDLAAVHRIINEHPALLELVLPQYQFPLDGVHALIDQLDSLKEFRFIMRHSEYNDLVLQLNNEWCSTSYRFWYYNDDTTLATFCRKMR